AIDGTNTGSPVSISTTAGVTAAIFDAGSLPVGTHTITASYAGDTSFTSSVSSALAQTVGKASTSTAIVSSANASVFGQAVTFTATVGVAAPGSGTPAGAGQFIVDGTTVGSRMGVSTSGGVTTAGLTVRGLAVGTHTVSASYGGDGSFTGSSGALPGGQVVNK